LLGNFADTYQVVARLVVNSRTKKDSPFIRSTVCHKNARVFFCWKIRSVFDYSSAGLFL